MSSHVGTIIVGDFSPTGELGGHHSSSAEDPNFQIEQGKPRCMPNLLTRVVINLFACKCIVHLRI
jgi:hypothetical protein